MEEKRMIGEYEVVDSMYIGHKEIAIAKNPYAAKDERYICCYMLILSVTAFASGTDPLTAVSNLSTFIFGLIRAIGLILLGFGVVLLGLSFKSHDPSQRANGFMTIAGGY